MEQNKRTCYGIDGDIRCNCEIDKKEFYCIGHSYQRNEKDYFVKNMQKLLNEQTEKYGFIEKYRKCCDIFDFAKYNRNFVNSWSIRFNQTVNDKLNELLTENFILKDVERKNKIDNYKKYFVWMDLEEKEEEEIKYYQKLEINEKTMIQL